MNGSKYKFTKNTVQFFEELNIKLITFIIKYKFIY